MNNKSAIKNKKITIKIDGTTLKFDKPITILEACETAKIKIPTLCKVENLHATGSCRICSVEVKNARTLLTACSTPIADGMEILTHTRKVIDARKTILQLILANHHEDCFTCDKNLHCKLQELAYEYDVKILAFEGETRKFPVDDSSPSFVRNPSKCILCGRCVQVCDEIQTVEAICFSNRGFNTVVGPPLGYKIAASDCTNCGQCVLHCPTCALEEKEHIEDVWTALSDPTKHVIAQVAPAVRVALGEEFEMAPGTVVTDKIVESLKKMGFAKVFDTTFSADMTIMEEGHELVHRLKTGGVTPMFTSCCPGWVRYVESFYPELIPNLSSSKSPHMMFGVLLKTYYAKLVGIDPKDVIVVSVMPCVAKKSEIERKGISASGYKDIDYVVTTRELAKMIKSSGIEFARLKGQKFDEMADLMGEGSGAGVIFGSSGGVMEAALRTCYEIITGSKLNKLEFEKVRGKTTGFERIGVSEIKIGEKTLRVAVASGLISAKMIIEMIKKGEKFDFIEVMACPGGCINGGGQPYYDHESIVQKRKEGIYKADKKLKVRQSHENPLIKKVYKDYFGEPYNDKSKKLLHTGYISRKRVFDEDI